MTSRAFPLIPQKSSDVEDGDFFSIPLSDGRFGCGRVLSILRKSGKRTKTLLCGLHDWAGPNHPEPQDIDGTPIIEQGVMSLEAIAWVKGSVLGWKDLSEDGLKPLLQVEAGRLLAGFEDMGPLPENELKKYSRRTIYGLGVIRILAEHHFVRS
jgi:hypothetical protein